MVQEKYHPSVYSWRLRYMAERSGRVIAVYDGRGKGGTVWAICFARMAKREPREIPVGESNLPSKSWKKSIGIHTMKSLGFHEIFSTRGVRSRDCINEPSIQEGIACQ